MTHENQPYRGSTMTAWPFNDLAPLSCDLIVADPPWDFENYSDAGTAKGADPHYEVMPLDAITALPVGQLARGDCLLLLWTTAGGGALNGAWRFADIVVQGVTKRYQVLIGNYNAGSNHAFELHRVVSRGPHVSKGEGA